MKNLHTSTFCLAVLLILAACAPQQAVLPVTPTPAVTTVPAATVTTESSPSAEPIAAATDLLPISPAASAYLEEALDIMQNNSLHKDSIDWEALRTTTFKIAAHAQTPADTYGAIRYALFQLGDHHSSFLTAKEYGQIEQLTMNDSPTPRSKLLLGKIGFVAIEGFGSGILEEANKYASIVQRLIREVDSHNPCGWIMDLRENTGGGIGAMIAGLGPILGEGELGAFVDVDGHKEIWFYQDGKALLFSPDGQALLSEQEVIQVNGPAYQLKADSPPVAVLTGVNTASAGEAIVVAFRGRPHTRSFGLYTNGVPTRNEGFPLSDGAMIILTVGVYADRTGQTYGDRIYPDELVDDVRKFTPILDEAIPQPAIDWLLSQPECAAQ